MKNQKIILDLCGGTGAWSRPWKDAGYDVKVVTLPWEDIRHTRIMNDMIIFYRDKNHVGRHWVKIKDVYGILAAPPCTMFSLARTKAKTPRDLKEGMECVRACLNIIWTCMEVKQDTKYKTVPLKFWAMENPNRGMLKKFLGQPAMIFNPWQFGDGYKKETALWGNFKTPKMKYLHWDKKLIKFDKLKSKDIHPEAFGKLNRTERRAITPAGFAKAFFEANL